MNKFLLLWVFLCAALSGFAQEMVSIRGQVFSSQDKTTIPGASVYVDKLTVGEKSGVPGVINNSSIGTVTDVDGKFSLSVPKGTEFITVSFLGFNSKRVMVLNKSDVKVFLETAQSELNSVIVTGYANIQKRKSTVAAAKVNYDQIRQVGVAGVDQMLQGQVAGVNITSVNGGPNAPIKIRIRGTVSIQGTQDPLWVIDGMPLEGTAIPNTFDKNNIDELRNLPIAGLNTDDIADITVLKDAAATAIYGARAANGVIVITTKKGKAGPVSVNLSANTFVSERPDFGKLNLMNSDQKVDFELGLAARGDLGVDSYRPGKGQVMRILNGANELDAYRNGGFSALTEDTRNAINSLRNTNTDWGKELYGNTVNQQYNLNLSGGNERANYYFSGGYYNEKGSTIGTGFERFNATLKTDFHINDKLTLGVSAFGTASRNKGFLTEADAFTNPNYYSRNANPYLGIYNADGSYAYDVDMLGYEDRVVPFNIIEERNNTSNVLKTQSIKSIFDLNYRIIPELTVKSQFGIQFDNTGNEKYSDVNSYYSRKYKEGTRYYDSATKQYKYFLPTGGIIQNNNGTLFQYNWKTMVEYNKVFNTKHELDLMAGTELRQVNNDQIGTKGFGYNPRTLSTQQIMFRNPDDAENAKYRAYQKSVLEDRYASFFATASYTYDNRYTVFGSVRYDGSNLFGVDPKYRYLPIWSVAGSWNAKNESFLKDVNWLSSLKLRASYGLQGNIDKNTSPFVVGVYDNNTSILVPSQSEQIITVNNPPNAKLRWEKTANFNGGIDLGVLNNRIQVTFDVYNRKSTDLLGLRALPLENGFQFTNANFGQVTNKGYELSISSHNISNRNFSWSTDFNIAHNNSNVDKVNIQNNSWLPSTEGHPLTSVFSIKTAGLDADGLPQFVRKDGTVASMEDFFKLTDPWGIGLVTSELSYAEYRDLYTYAGNTEPKFVGGLTNRFRYKSFDLSVSANFTLNQLMVRNPPYIPSQVDRGLNYSADILNAWTPENMNTTMPAIISSDYYSSSRPMAAFFMAPGNDPGNFYRSLDIWNKKMSYVRINSVRLGYSLPAAIASKIKASNVRFNVEGRNLFVFGTGYKGFFDPESYGNIYAQPLARTFSLGLNVTF